MSVHDDIIALIPAAGFATRLGRLPCSKELLPVGWSADRAGAGRTSGAVAVDERPLAGYLLERLAEGGIGRALIITRPDKTDISAVLGDGSRWGLDLDYLVIEPTSSTVETLDAAYARTRGSNVALGYPDIIFKPKDAYSHVVDRYARTGAEVALGLFPSDQPEASDMVELGPDGSVERLVIKQPDRGLGLTWSIAVWSPAFTEYLHEYLRRGEGRTGELYVGDVIQSAIDEKRIVTSVAFQQGASTDLGTPETLENPPQWVTG